MGQALTLLNACLDRGSVAPLTELVERLVVEGPRHLPVLACTLEETQRRRQQVEDDLALLWEELCRNWQAQRLPPLPLTSLEALLTWDEVAQHTWLRQHVPPTLLEHSERMLRNARALGHDAFQALCLLREIEDYLRDWLWGLAQQAMREMVPLYGPTPSSETVH